MKSHKKLIIVVLLLIGLGAVSTALGFIYYAYTPITAVEINSHSDNDTVFAGGEFTVTCTTSTDRDKYCDSLGWHYPSDPVTHTWSGDGQGFDPGTGTSVTWTAPTATGGADITVTANDSPLYNEPAKTDTVTLTVTNIIYVDTNATGKNDGSSWADAFVYLQDALTAADNANVSDNEIWVAEGTYKPTSGSSQSATFELVEYIEMYGGFDGTETSRNQRDYANNVTILSGDIDNDGLDADNSHHVVTGKGSSDTVIDGFTITMGYSDYWLCDGGGMNNLNCSPTVANCIFSNNKAYGGDGDGGGMNNSTASPTVTNCTFTNNIAGDDAGALCNKYGSNGTFTSCTFSNNSTEGDNDDSHGGAIYNTAGEPGTPIGSSPTFINCVISDNNTVHDGGGVANADPNTDPCFINCTFSGNAADTNDGGAMANRNGSCPIVTDCNFVSNSAADDGGAVANKNGSNGTFTGCSFTSNSANDDGGAVHNTITDDPNATGSSPTFTDCNFGTTTIGDRNSAINDGGAVHNKGDGTDPTYLRCDFVDNQAGDDGGAMASKDGSDSAVTNCVFYNNQSGDHGGAIFNTDGADVEDLGSSPTFTNCLIANNTADDATDNNEDGGGAFNSGDGTDPTYINCTFTGNTADDNGDGMATKDSSSPTVTNCIFWDNGDEIWTKNDASITVTYSDVEGTHAGIGNQNVDPNFVDDTDPDGTDNQWRTSDDGLVINETRCIDAANGNVDPTTDILGNSRYDDSNWSNIGIGNPTYVDMGAYEYQGS